jgi:hypothetical protein
MPSSWSRTGLPPPMSPYRPAALHRPIIYRGAFLPVPPGKQGLQVGSDTCLAAWSSSRDTWLPRNSHRFVWMSLAGSDEGRQCIPHQLRLHVCTGSPRKQQPACATFSPLGEQAWEKLYVRASSYLSKVWSHYEMISTIDRLVSNFQWC